MNGRNAWHDLERPGVEVTPEDRADPVGLVRGKAALKKTRLTGDRGAAALGASPFQS
jgi:hypothetical protein